MISIPAPTDTEGKTARLRLTAAPLSPGGHIALILWRYLMQVMTESDLSFCSPSILSSILSKVIIHTEPMSSILPEGIAVYNHHFSDTYKKWLRNEHKS